MFFSSFGDTPVTRNALFEKIEKGYSLTLDEAAGLIKKNDNGRQYYYVFEVEERMDIDEILEYERCPYLHFSRDKDLYSRLGLEESYEWAKAIGYLEPTPHVDFSNYQSMSISDLKQLDTMFFGEYAVTTIGDTNHIFIMDGEKLVGHTEVPFVLFKKNKLEEAIGLGFIDLVRKLGVPSFASGDGECAVDYMSGYSVYRLRFDFSSSRLIVSDYELIPSITRAIRADEEKEEVDASLALSFRDYASLESLIRKVGKNVSRCPSTSALHYALFLNDGTYLTFSTWQYDIDFDNEHRGEMILGLEHLDELPDWWYR
ncbi:MAG: hypothetical protein J6328_01585 [Bacilli bacterium]|nr:hypothetical protein [Bacilli bacterium]